MSQDALNLLASNEDVIQLKEIIKNDPTITTIEQQLPIIVQYVNGMFDMAMPQLDGNEVAVKEANAWLVRLQQNRDSYARYDAIVKTYEFQVKRYWSLAHNICMTQPVIEGMKSNEQRNAHIERLFNDLARMKEDISLALKKLDIIKDNLQQAYYHFMAQQKNLQLLAGMRRFD